LVNRKLLPL